MGQFHQGRPGPGGQEHVGRRRRRADRWVPVCVRRPQQSDAAVSVQFDLTLGPFDGAFEALAEETLEEVEKSKIRRSGKLKGTPSDLRSSCLEN